jgi:K+/H+ antiporter YhaU regulatory subunit KhtT
MYGIILLLVVAMLSLLITRIATIALTATGMARPSARFQARSALSGVGFTTTESEAVVAHPARRRIIMALMLVGSVGLATSIAGILAGVVGKADASARLTRAAVLVVGLAIIYWVSLSKRVDRRLSSIIGRALARFTDLDVRDYAALLHVSGEYEVKEMLAAPGAWITGQTLGDLRLRDEGVLVLGIVREDGSYLGVPTKHTRIEAGDTMILYGRDGPIAELTARRPGASGDHAHEAAVARQQEVAGQEPESEPGHGGGGAGVDQATGAPRTARR